MAEENKEVVEETTEQPIEEVVEQKTENFMNFLGDLEDDTSEKPEGNESSPDGSE